MEGDKVLKIVGISLGILAFTGVGVIVYFHVKNSNAPAVPKAPPFKADVAVQNKIQTQAVSKGKPSIVWRNDSFPLSIGSKGQNVSDLQQFLGVVVDGYFGYDTLDQLNNITGLSSVASVSDYAPAAPASTDKVVAWQNAEGVVYPFKAGAKVYATDTAKVFYNPSDEYLLGHINKGDAAGYYVAPSKVAGFSKVTMPGYFNTDGSFTVQRAVYFIKTLELTNNKA